MLPVEFIPEPMFVNEVLQILTRQRKSLAVVIDEYGGASGILTIEDIVEELLEKLKMNMIMLNILKRELIKIQLKFLQD